MALGQIVIYSYLPTESFFSKDRLYQHPKNADVIAGVKLRLGWTTVK